MKKLYKRLAAIYFLSAMTFIAVFAVGLYSRLREDNGYYLYQLLGSVDNNLERGTDEYSETVRSIADQCVKRARETAYIIREDEKIYDRKGLETLRELMDVGAISVIDFSGNIVLSTDPELEGTREEDEVFEGLMENPSEDAFRIRVDEPDFWEYPAYFYAVVSAESEQFAAVRIDGDLNRLNLPSGADRVRTVLKQATTEYDTSIFAAGKARGRIIGITENNSQDIRIENVEEGQQMLEFLSGLPEGKPLIMRINDKYQSVVIRERDDMYLAAFTGMDQLVSDVWTTVIIVVSIIGIISIATVIMVRLYIRKYMFDYFEQIRAGILGVLDGEKTGSGKESEIPELKMLKEMIGRLEREYVDKSENMDRIADELSAARNEAEYDRLTGLYNRNGFERRAEEFLKQKNASGALVLFDLDNFKKVNDMEGHPEGDRLLVNFAKCLPGSFRRDDVIGRLGGDEFVVLIRSEVSEQTLKMKFESFFQSLHTTFHGNYEKYKVSASAGAVRINGNRRDYGSLYQRADTALYIAKYMGKDGYYINEAGIACMRQECINCRAECPRSRIITDRNKYEYPPKRPD